MIKKFKLFEKRDFSKTKKYLVTFEDDIYSIYEIISINLRDVELQCVYSSPATQESKSAYKNRLFAPFNFSLLSLYDGVFYETDDLDDAIENLELYKNAKNYNL